MTSPPVPQGENVVDLDRLDELAKMAALGPYTIKRDQSALSVDGSRWVCVRWAYNTHASRERDIAYLAALDPSTVRYLVARARRAQEAEDLIVRFRTAIAQRRLGPSLRQPGWMDEEAALMRETARLDLP